jgi:hypothetical protein
MAWPAGPVGRPRRRCGLWALTAWAQDEIGFHRLELDHSTRNHSSCRVATKSGYLLEGAKCNAAVRVDGRQDMLLHAFIRGDRVAVPARTFFIQLMTAVEEFRDT